MTARTDYDVVIVGASLAGCTAAILLARSGAQVALVEQRPDLKAYKRICTHFIQSSGIRPLQRIGLLEKCSYRVLVGYLDRRGGVRVAEFGSDGTRAVGVAVGDDHPAAICGQRMGHRSADARGATDDDRRAISHTGSPSGRGSFHLAVITPHGSA